MKKKMHWPHTLSTGTFLTLIVLTCFTSGRAQTVIPQVCIQPNHQTTTTTLPSSAWAGADFLLNFTITPDWADLVINPGGATEERFPSVRRGGNSLSLNSHLAYAHSAGETVLVITEQDVVFGYTNTSTTAVTIPRGTTGGNYFAPGPIVYAQQATSFLPGIHGNSFTVKFGSEILANFAWYLNGIASKVTSAPRCGTITYQGRLSDAGTTANGNYDLQFEAYDTPTEGTPQTERVTVSSVPVTDGIFTVPLKFTNGFTDSADARFFEIGIRPGGSSGAFTILTPRQPITDVPYAIRALRADTATNATNAGQLGGVPASQYLTTSAGIQNSTTQQANSNFNISGNGTVGGNLTVTGTLNATLPSNSTSYIRNSTGQQANADFNVSGTGAVSGSFSAGQYKIGGNPVLSIAGTNNTFVGLLTGPANTTGVASVFVGETAGLSNTEGSGNSFVGVEAGRFNSTGALNSFYGLRAGYGNRTGGFNSFFGQGSGISNITGTNNVAIGANADVGANDLNFATAIGSGAIVRKSNTIALGREGGQDLVQIFRLGSAGITQLCLSAINEISGCSSSLRYKTNITPFRFGLSFINQLQPIAYDWKTSHMKDVGFGAEDVARINPLFVTYNAAGEVEGVKYDRLSAVFVNAFKEQQTQIEVLQQQLAEQRLLTDGLRKLVCQQNPMAAACH